jgi:omega-amidase
MGDFFFGGIVKLRYFYKMKIALIQSPLLWENPVENRQYFEKKIYAITETVDLIVLPEMFTSGFTMNAANVCETMKGETLSWLSFLAKEKNAAITGSLVITEKGNYYNRFVFVFPSGEIQFYDKRHLFTLAGEDTVYKKGNKKIIVEYRGWKICLQICYDLRFPVFVRNIENYDLLLYVASWPKARINAWDVLLRARAIENMCYTVGVNRLGQDDSKFEYNGHSQVIDFLGDYCLEPQEKEGVFILALDKQKMIDTRNKFNFLNDKDCFLISDL